MRVAIGGGASDAEAVDYVVEAERLGVDSVWVPEMWGYDALTALAFLAAKTERIRLGTGIIQLGARTPALLAMSAMGMQALSGGRFLLGLGTSGPQVMESWHGVPFSSPIGMTRETIEIVRKVVAGERLVHNGRSYQLPLPGRAGRPMRSMAPPTTIPIYVAALGPNNLELTGERADGWLANCFIPEAASTFLQPLRAGAERGGRSLSNIDIVVPAAVEFTDDPDEAARRHARGYAFTIGAMGSRDHNFYNDAFARQGYGEEVRAVQTLWLDGKRDEAAEAVPLDLGRKTNLLGSPGAVEARLEELYRAAGVGTIQAKVSGSLDERLATLATLVEICASLDVD